MGCGKLRFLELFLYKPVILRDKLLFLQIWEYHRRHPTARYVDTTDEYEELLKVEPTIGFTGKRLMVQMGDWVVCRLYQRKKRGINQGMINKLGKSKKSRKNELQASPSSCSSEITEVSCSDKADQEASNCSFTF